MDLATRVPVRCDTDADLLEAVIRDVRHMLAHEMRVPLVLMEADARQLERECTEQRDGQSPDYLARTQRSVRRLANQADGMLELLQATTQPLVPEAVDLSALAERIVDRLRQREPQRRCRVDVQPGLACTADPQLLAQLMEILLDNAWKFTSRRASARIVVARAPLATPLMTTFCISDDGAGFDPSLAEGLFTAFHRCHPERDFPGAGVGLAIAGRIVSRHGGRICAEAAAGTGCMVSFSLPAGACA